MSDDPTKDIGEKYTTQPTIQTVVEMIGEFRAAMERRFDELESRLNVRIDRVESLASTTRGEMLALRADFTELKNSIREHFPAVK